MAKDNTSLPKVSVICLCYNHAAFVRSSILSVLNQTYPNIEVIIINDASPDNSTDVIQGILKDHPEILFLDLPQNIGNCKAFNQGLKKATGKYIIDLSCDDELKADRITKQVAAFERLPNDYGVLYSDATYIDEQGKPLGDHFSSFSPTKGEVYAELVRRYFIAPPTMMIRKEVLMELGGYNEALAYEDFDFWVRSARNWKYDFVNEPLTRIRKTSGSLSSKFHVRDSPLIDSTLTVCKKIKALNQNEAEDIALAERIQYELKIACLTGSRSAAKEFYELLSSIQPPDLASRFWLLFSRLRWNVFALLRGIRRG
ncbi:MAG: glycosyltransferase [Cytophagales bacterium]|nr:glycosyltransferase [Cytophagales bacterium]